MKVFYNTLLITTFNFEYLYFRGSRYTHKYWLICMLWLMPNIVFVELEN